MVLVNGSDYWFMVGIVRYDCLVGVTDLGEILDRVYGIGQRY